MSAKKTYEISFAYRASTYSSADTVRLTIGNGNTIAAQNKILLTQTVFNAVYYTQHVTYSPTTSGNYAIALNCASGPLQKEIYIDNIVINENPSLKTIYVKQNAVGNNNGTSWTNAFTTLTAALTAAVAGDTIKVAKGTYKPTTNMNDRSATFFIKDYMVLLGGYPDTGNPTDADRRWGRNPTILSGKIDTITNWWNTRQLVNLYNVSEKCILDGFVISDTYADDTYNPNGPYFRNYGGGLVMTNSSASVRNCVFKNNRAQWEGAALAINGGMPEVLNCFFVNNGTDPTLTSAIYVYQNAQPRLHNCVFAFNTCASVIKLKISNANVTNSSFVGNHPYNLDVNRGTIFCDSNSALTVRNVIFFGNRIDHSTDSTDIVTVASTVDIANTITQAYEYGNRSLTGVNPKFVDTSSVAGPDGLFFTADDGLQLINPCSPAINTGQNNAIGSLSTDILGASRIANGIVDLGAYEMQSSILPIPKTLYVNKLATGSNDGTSWVNAFTDLQKAFHYCSDTIRVASGSYSPSATDERASFWMENKRVILGGYPPSNNPSDAQRNPLLNPTVLTGDLPNGKRSVTLLRGPFLDSSAKLDGFLITRVNTETRGYDNDAVGAVFLTNYSSPEFSNCIFTNNFGSYGSVLVTRRNSNPRFANCIFETDTVVVENNPSGPGGIITNFESNPSFRKCIFRKNSHFLSVSVTVRGGVFYNVNSNPVIDSCLFLNNQTYGAGAALFNLNSNPVIKHCQFIGNMPGAFDNGSYIQGTMGGDIFNSASSPLIQNCLFVDSFFCDNGGSIANVDGSHPVFEHCEFRNTRAVYKGGTVYNDNAAPVFTSCIFYNDSLVNYLASTMRGASFYNRKSTVKLYNCLAVGAYGYVGAFMENAKSSTELTNCVISGNRYILNSYSYLSTIYSYDSSRTTINNCIFWKNEFGNQTYYDFLDSGNGNYQPSSTAVTNSMLESITSLSGINNNMVGVDPEFNDDARPAGGDNIFYSTDDGFILQSCSPAVNSGLNSVIGPLTTDILANNRIIGGTVDRGAYEFTGAPTVLITASDSSICQGETVTFTASGSNGGNNPLYQWQLNGLNVATSNSYTNSSLQNNDMVRVILTSNASCLTNGSPIVSPSIRMQVATAVTASISITGNTTALPGQQVIINATSINGGSLPFYRWQDSTSIHGWRDIPGAEYPSLIYTAQNGNKLRCFMTTSANCATPLVAESNVLIFGTVTGVNPVAAGTYGIRMFPNPASDALVIDKIKLADKWKSAVILSQNGSQVKRNINIAGKETVLIPIVNLPQGVYLVFLRSEKGWTAIMKFVILR
jgi:hypothetical protein